MAGLRYMAGQRGCAWRVATVGRGGGTPKRDRRANRPESWEEVVVDALGSTMVDMGLGARMVAVGGLLGVYRWVVPSVKGEVG